MIYDPDRRATTTDLMQHAYFQHDQFPERYEVELRRIIDLEKEREQSDRVRRKRNKKVDSPSRKDHPRSLVSRKESHEEKRLSVE